MNNKRNLLIHVLCWGFVACMPLLFGHSDDQWPRTLHHFLRSLGGTLTSVVAVAIIAMKCSGKKNEQGVGFETMKVSRTDITTSVTATGTVEAVTTVTVGTQVSGILKHLYVDYNSPVRKGQVIAELDRTNLETELASAQANLRSAEADLQYQQKNYARYSERLIMSELPSDVCRTNY